jgi:hypothetical protein
MAKQTALHIRINDNEIDRINLGLVDAMQDMTGYIQRSGGRVVTNHLGSDYAAYTAYVPAHIDHRIHERFMSFNIKTDLYGDVVDLKVEMPKVSFIKSSLKFSVYDRNGVIVAKVGYGSDAALVVSNLGDGAFVKSGHTVVWIEGKEVQEAAADCDLASIWMNERMDAKDYFLGNKS